MPGALDFLVDPTQKRFADRLLVHHTLSFGCLRAAVTLACYPFCYTIENRCDIEREAQPFLRRSLNALAS